MAEKTEPTVDGMARCVATVSVGGEPDPIVPAPLVWIELHLHLEKVLRHFLYRTTILTSLPARNHFGRKLSNCRALLIEDRS